MGTDPKTGFRQVFPLHFNLAVFNEVRTKFPHNVSEVVASEKLCTVAYDYVAESVCERRS